MRRGAISRVSHRVGALVLGAIAAGAVLAPAVAVHPGDMRFPDLLNAPPTRIRLVDQEGRLRVPFIYPWRLVDRLEQRYEIDAAARTPLAWFSSGRLVQSSDEGRAPLLLLGSDSFGRDVWSRVLYGARTSLGLAMLAALASVVIGCMVGGAAGYAGGAADEVLMRGTEFVLVLPAMYVALALRAVMPLTLSAPQVLVLLLSIFAVLGAPSTARGVRVIVRTERRLDYAAAAESLGAGHVRLLARHLLPATRGFLAVQLTLLVPAFIVAEATLSYVGLGFPDPVASWGTMLHDASNLRTLADFPWLLSPAAAMFIVVLAVNLLVQREPSPLGIQRGP
jgi:peptide/nickel transport system permease protein